MCQEDNNMLVKIKCPRCGTKYPKPELGAYVCTVCKFHERIDCAIARSRCEAMEDITIEEAVEMTARMGFNQKERIKRELEIEMDELEHSSYNCQKCGLSIPYGRYCDDCKKRIGEKLRNARKSFLKKF